MRSGIERLRTKAQTPTFDRGVLVEGAEDDRSLGAADNVGPMLQSPNQNRLCYTRALQATADQNFRINTAVLTPITTLHSVARRVARQLV
jgi:hypothetical protein